ncbi:MAG TPA: ester cyclase family protein [Vicinamibacterales bacterium]|nr:ester cyclase family protein [Vicinamibacterales bacterium]
MLGSTLQDHSAIALELFAAVDAGDLVRVAALLDDDFQLHYHGVAGAISRETLVEMIRGYYDSFPGMRHDVLDVLPSGEFVTLRMITYAIHAGLYEGIPATGRQVAVAAIHLLRVANGRVVQWWAAEDDLGLLRQLGAVVAHAEGTKNVVRRYFDLLQGTGTGAVGEIIASDCSIAAPVLPVEIRGIETISQVVAGLRATFPDVRFTVHDVIAEGDRAVAAWTMTGTHRGEWLGVPATGRQLSITGVDTFHLAEGKIRRIEIQADYLGAMRQMGVAVGGQ